MSKEMNESSGWPLSPTLMSAMTTEERGEKQSAALGEPQGKRDSGVHVSLLSRWCCEPNSATASLLVCSSAVLLYYYLT